MKTLKIIILLLAYVFNTTITNGQSAMTTAKESLKTWYSLLKSGNVQTIDGKYNLQRYSISLDSVATLTGKNADFETAKSVFKIQGKIKYKLNQGYYEFSGDGIEAVTSEQSGKTTKSTILFRIGNFTKVKADSLVFLFDKITKDLKLADAEAKEMEAQKERNEIKSKADKKVFYDKVKAVDINRYFFNLTLPNTKDKSFATYTFYENPLMVGDAYYSGFKFTPTIDGYLYWYFHTFEKGEDSFYLLDSDRNVDDIDVSYFNKMALFKDEDNKSSWVIQKSAEKLKKGKTYVLWFKAKSKIPPHKKKIFAAIEASNSAMLSEYFNAQFDEIVGDF
ncbi:hypothetical protein D7322_07225 [Sphingobacterium puteale]|uniref:DUF4488 domain-containing protein n=2 Tax=Sphingobacterium TaxID=28453 RepID=A0A363NP18_9SPHI|nr:MULTISPECIES: hypothetical protein [Sphingobacterium]PUV22518.1 hypothetical protein DCO56_20115 [Sphingobacterium athyrii]RKO72577.1 hypothetical protein D7322_07225 [Sphingobacterium puteale]